MIISTVIAAIGFGSFLIWIFVAVGIVVLILAVANRKELDAITKRPAPKNEPPQVVGKPWKCPKCGEEIDPQFAQCWKCGAIAESGGDA
jgi:hypothetical protein